MMKANRQQTFIPTPPDNSCACNECPHMKRNTLEKVYLCMEYETPEITRGRASICVTIVESGGENRFNSQQGFSLVAKAAMEKIVKIRRIKYLLQDYLMV